MTQQQRALGYSREQAIKDGVLVDATELAHELGFRYGVALTKTAWERCVLMPEGVVSRDEASRLHDVLCMLASAVRRGEESSDIGFRVYLRNSTANGAPPIVHLRSRCGTGDDGMPCLTIMLPGEN